MGSSLLPQRTFFGTTEQYCEDDQAIHVALGHSHLGGKNWAETAQSALPKAGSYDAQTFPSLHFAHRHLKCLAREFLSLL